MKTYHIPLQWLFRIFNPDMSEWDDGLSKPLKQPQATLR